MNCRQSLDFKVEKLEEEIIWVNERKDIVKNQLREKIDKKSKGRLPNLNWEWLKVSTAVVSISLLCFVLIGNIANKKSGVQENHQAGPVSYIWHNLEIKPVLPPSDVKWGEFENVPLMIKSHKNFGLTESQKRASFKIMRPTIDLQMPLEVSRGVIVYPPFLTAKEFKGPITYWDIWHSGDKWAYVNQSLAENSRQLLSKKEKKAIEEIQSNAKFIPFNNKDVIAILTDLGDYGKRINMYVKSDKDQVIDFVIRGNINEEELIKLAKSYVEK
ncbi:hypothetical protein [Neobacillus sp.]|uniref:hypothetical protein n=1 Tax=Neobacillus sp. TaxID=2675273 RepID=UPI00289ABD3B|nr:hypothetical protein [Neobacillus sp.]